ncbi:HSP20-like chaperone, partial [Dimargaris cristalligena]
WHPTIDIFETDTEVTIQAELPGVDGTKVICDVYKGSLMIVGETHRDEKMQKSLTHGERDVGNFCRRIPLPDIVLSQAKDSKASFTNGVLTIVLPK